MNRINFSLTQIEYVLAVRKYGHFAKAAKNCHITQPTLSMQIQKFEETLGIVIFDRSKKPILLTDEGEKIINQLQTILFEVKKVTSLIETSKNENLSGELIVGIIPTVASDLLPRLLLNLRTQCPELRLTLRELQTQRIIDSLDNDEIDVGLLALPLQIPKIHELPLYYEPFSVLCHKKHPLGKKTKINYKDLQLDDLWLLEEGHCLRDQLIEICSLKRKESKNNEKKKPQFLFESGHLETLKNLIQSIGGYTLLPALSTDHYGKDTALVPFEPPAPSRQIGLAYQRIHHKNELIEVLASNILYSIPAQLRRLRPQDLNVIPAN